MSEKMPYIVSELGEDSDAWIVQPGEGWLGGSEEGAKVAVVEWLHECVGDDASAFGYHVAELLRTPVTRHLHWAWHTNNEHDDPELIRLDGAHSDVETFAGWLFSSHVPPAKTLSEYLARKPAL